MDELGENTIELMRAVKKAIDPLNIMNPSKVSFKPFRVHKIAPQTLSSYILTKRMRVRSDTHKSRSQCQTSNDFKYQSWTYVVIPDFEVG